MISIASPPTEAPTCAAPAVTTLVAVDAVRVLEEEEPVPLGTTTTPVTVVDATLLDEAEAVAVLVAVAVAVEETADEADADEVGTTTAVEVETAEADEVVEVEEAELPEPPAATSLQNLSVAGNTWPVATSRPHLSSTQGVAAVIRAALLAQMHLKSVTWQVVALPTAAMMQGCAHAGMMEMS
jgi:hypothetical protein